ncbi:ParB/RepB/Spo0J family partition protein [Novipirellula artificiosorum]|uniref:Putative chromosome-partitioning protein ParB n=1 Tax=Novipirellula artificiosorum TaxID=2528016 RepID=A0A5C6DQ19_9BACT|nr:ParB N-terminal domain-containing protein [Novipirellula artificiosorum]TWU39373.1 putative chromosome-partitioning protein ParB [Novipirellula artificiosorum]
MEPLTNICSIANRRYEEVPIEKVKVINSRNRDKEQFEMNVESIEGVGLMKPIRVNDKFLDTTGFYELICGEGRLLAHKQLAKTHVPAEVVTCTRKEALLQSLIENIARTKPGSMDFARELKRLHDEGWEYKRIAQIACKSEHYIRDYIRLVEQGEERLIQGVENGIFPIKFAIQVSSTEDSQIQNVLMDAFDAGLVTTNNFGQARRIISARAKQSKKSPASRDYTVVQLRQDIAETTRVKTSYVREAKTKENRFMTLLSGVNMLFKDGGLVELLKQQQLDKRPELSGDFQFDPSANSEVSS